jgi:hypothetical protein
VDEHTAWFIIDVEGDEAEIERAVAWLEEETVRVERIPSEQ